MSDSYIVLCTYINGYPKYCNPLCLICLFFAHLSTLHLEEVLSPLSIVPHLPPILCSNDRASLISK